MKKTKPYLIALLLPTIVPFAANAAEHSIAELSGLSDLTLLTLMLSLIVLLLFVIYALSNSVQAISKSSNYKKKIENNTSTGTKLKSWSALLILSTASFSSYASGGNATAPSFVMSDALFWILFSFMLILAYIIFVLYKAFKTLIKLERGESLTTEKSESIFDGILVDRVAVEDEQDIMLDHEYDGIRELDNNLPPWWIYLFYGTIIFAVVYMVRFHITGDGKTGIEEYEIEMAEAAAKREEMIANNEDMITEDNVTYLTSSASIEAGSAIYKGNCATCHGQLGEGGAGPNLTDKYWINGGSIRDIFSVIKYGVPEKGMIAWESQFSPEQIQEVASYIMTLEGTNPPNQRPPQGELYEPKEENVVEEEGGNEEEQTEDKEV